MCTRTALVVGGSFGIIILAWLLKPKTKQTIQIVSDLSKKTHIPILPIDQMKVGYQIYCSSFGVIIQTGVSHTIHRSRMNNALFEAVHLAFARHYPLELTPEDIYYALVQTIIPLKQRLADNADFQKRIGIGQLDKERIVIYCDHYGSDAKMYDWSDCLPEFRDNIVAKLGGSELSQHDIFRMNFSKSTDTQDLALAACAVSAFANSFSSKVTMYRGNPKIRITGTEADWKLVIARWNVISKLFRDFLPIAKAWTEHVDDFLAHMLQSIVSPEPQTQWFKQLYMFHEANGLDCSYSTGNLNRLFPWSWSQHHGSVETKFVGTREKLVANTLSPSITSVPFVWNHIVARHDMHFHAGMLGIHQHKNGFIRPVSGWVVTMDD